MFFRFTTAAAIAALANASAVSFSQRTEVVGAVFDMSNRAQTRSLHSTDLQMASSLRPENIRLEVLVSGSISTPKEVLLSA